MNLWEMTALELRDLLVRREVSALQVLEEHLERIESVEPRVGAFLAIHGERAREQASKADALLREGSLLPLAGIPVALKDIICLKGHPTTCGSRMLESFCPPYSATVVRRLEEAGAVFLGKTNLDEFAMGSSNENSALAVTRNPWNPEYVPGGSSGGSAAAVAARETPLALGSDTGGSIRLPASFCGVVGMKPTYGRVSRYGLVAFASSLDQIGPFARTVSDAALLLEVISGKDHRDSTSANIPVPHFQDTLGNLKNGTPRIGIPREFLGDGVDPEVRGCVEKAITLLSSEGFSFEEVSFPHLEYALPAYYIISCAEASSNLARYDGGRYGLRAEGASNVAEMVEKTREMGFGKEVKRRIILGTYALSAGYYDAYYLKAQKVRTLIRHDFDLAFERVSVLLSPVSPTPAFRAGEKLSDPLTMYLSDIFALPVNLAGLPAISVPGGLSQQGLPIGVQFMGKPFDEETLLTVAHRYEQMVGWKEAPRIC